jgi:hypothetical protein
MTTAFLRWVSLRCAIIFAFTFIGMLQPSHAASPETSDTPVELVVWQRSFEGRIGEKPVKLPYFRRIGDRIEGAYCYGSCDLQTGDLRLTGTWHDDVLSLTESAPDASGKPQTTGHWRLQPDNDGWRGEWRSPDGQRRLPATLAADDNLVPPYELRVMAAFVPGTDDENCELQSPPVSAIRVYRDGALVQTLDTDSMGTCGIFLPQQVDMNFDGHVDLTIALMLPAGPNIPHQSWLFDPDRGHFIDAPTSLQELSSPEFDPTHRIVYHFWRGSCCSHGVETYRWHGGDLVAIDNQASHLMPVLRQGKLSYLYSVPGYDDGEIIYSPRLVRDRSGKLALEGVDTTTFAIDDEPFAWGPSLAVNVFAIDRKGASRRVRTETMRWRRIKDGRGVRWCPDLAVYDIDRHRIARHLVDMSDICSDTDPDQ